MFPSFLFDGPCVNRSHCMVWVWELIVMKARLYLVKLQLPLYRLIDWIKMWAMPSDLCCGDLVCENVYSYHDWMQRSLITTYVTHSDKRITLTKSLGRWRDNEKTPPRGHFINLLFLIFFHIVGLLFYHILTAHNPFWPATDITGFPRSLKVCKNL